MTDVTKPHESTQKVQAVEPWTLSAEQSRTNSLPAVRRRERAPKMTGREAEELQKGKPADGYSGGTSITGGK